ncbi:electron transport complex protein RnfB [Ectothiorhodosinus mongolicus]|uniref:Ion-translocating oxidoreductase complex subunit B n=1 Tax=Ectothiorhodosinus mongolicus TaxID=233100 RepID=A0A1R3VYZ4_9GAMM|nr:electron transport complex subunit RsxB [Ectothiorhodosinus mongolicus]ULX57206.1 electron transport complex subunit RsxB [Ectothiorhodosinus mongolicus]SIT70415.1 electron transport complex protein RnfB [Ectothiorhodosinus mongolicus]
MIAAILVIVSLCALFGIILGYSAVRFRVEGDPVADQINDLLPQTQCGQCGYAGCRPYAAAIAEGQADINRCPPGGETTVLALADLLGRDPKPLEGEIKEKSLAVIDEQTCIGCTLCIQACPVDAILGAAKQMHTVIAEQCTGCELCIAPCPVDCIVMLPIEQDIGSWKWPLPEEQYAGTLRLLDLARPNPVSS